MSDEFWQVMKFCRPYRNDSWRLSFLIVILLIGSGGDDIVYGYLRMDENMWLPLLHAMEGSLTTVWWSPRQQADPRLMDSWACVSLLLPCYYIPIPDELLCNMDIEDKP